MNKKYSVLMLLILLALLTAAAFFFTKEPAKQAFVPEASVSPEVSVSIIPSISPSPSPSPAISFEVVKTPHKQAKYIFIMIGDGMGQAQRDLAGRYAEFAGDKTPLIMNSLPFNASVATFSANSSITDSAAAATAYATGYKTNNGTLSISPDGEDLKTIMEEAESKGLSTGLITTTTITNATPAAFGAHEESRSSEAQIAFDYLDAGIDFLAGGGAKYLLPSSYSGGLDAIGKPLKSSRGDNKDAVSEYNDAGYKTFIGQQGAKDFTAYVPSAGDKVLASFTNDYMPYELDRLGDSLPTPSLAQMTQKGIETLATDEDGFVLMVEGGRIDHVCKANDPAGTIFETLSFNDAVQQAYDFYKQHPDETLIIVVGDHETGGLTLGSSLDFSCIKGIRLSTTERLHLAYTHKDREAYYTYLAQNFGLSDLSPSEKKLIDKALDFADSKNYKDEYQGSPACAVSGILSKRIGVQWAAPDHTDTPVPLYAVGLNAEYFSGDLDNTDVGKLLFELLDMG